MPCHTPGLSSTLDSSRGLLWLGLPFTGRWKHTHLRSLMNSDFPSTPVKTALSYQPKKFLPLSPRPDNCLSVLCPMVFLFPEHHTKEIIHHAAIWGRILPPNSFWGSSRLKFTSSHCWAVFRRISWSHYLFSGWRTWAWFPVLAPWTESPYTSAFWSLCERTLHFSRVNN